MRKLKTMVLNSVLCGSFLLSSLPLHAASDYGISEGNEELLLKGLESLASQQFDTALSQFKELTIKRPDFRLAQLVYADLMASQANPLGQIGSERIQKKKEINGLIDEARARLLINKDKPRVGLIPSSLIKMSDDQKYLIAIDTKFSRLFVFENRQGVPTLIKDYYASYGRGGTEKTKRGDLKTPLGVYFVTNRFFDSRLPERYGSGALPINYPNVWDSRKGRTGSGIWVHGSPVDTYSRPPKASEGCISLTNPDFIDLDKLIDIKNTPVLIGSDFKWIDQKNWIAQQNEIQQYVEQWRVDWESQEHSRYITHYSKKYSDGVRNYQAYSDYKKRINASKEFIKVDLKDISLFRYPNDPNLMVATFNQNYESNNYAGESVKRQYWVKEEGQWKIAYEGKPSKGKP
ncbi:L,D-transpeptidase family protein [Neptunomonas japonica]|uniref:L,D-transpeptidase family protein n=1 Tax=Neptunomonas japonica TaxID=417574 RepID=UPI0003FEED1F|nr:L,D-transpeptidase family protein [Neptunomonas japonica]